MKLRVWDDERGLMYSGNDFDVRDDLVVMFMEDGLGFYRVVKKEYIVLKPLLAVGLSDRNGVEIYDGDIVEADIGGDVVDPYEIVFENGRFTMKDVGSEDTIRWVLSESCVVIGNRYLNPELINGTN